MVDRKIPEFWKGEWVRKENKDYIWKEKEKEKEKENKGKYMLKC